MNAEDVLRIALLAGLAGFVVFCASYAILVWRKRNRGLVRGSSFFRVGLALVIVGGGAAGGIWTVTAFQDRSGVVSGDDIFVVPARRDASISRVSPKEWVEAGDILAEFVPAANDAELDLLDNRIDEARARLRGLEFSSPPVDPALAQRRDQLQAQINQARGFEFDLLRLSRELEKEELSLASGWARERSQIEAELSEARLQVESLAAQIAIAAESRDRAADLRARDLTPTQVLDERNTTLLSLRREHDRAEGAIEIAERRLEALKTENTETLRALSGQRARLDDDLAREGENAAALGAQLAEVESAITEDLQRARSANREEEEAARHQLAGLETELRRAVEATQVRSPVTGQVIYRHSAPGLVADGAPILAVSTGSGFVASVRLSEADAQAVAQAGPVRFITNEPLLTRFFTGNFRNHTPLIDGSDEVLAHFAVSLPPDAIMRLAAAETTAIPAVMQWSPPVFNILAYRLAMAAMLVGIMLMLLASLASRAPDRLVLTQSKDTALVPVSARRSQIRGSAIMLALVGVVGTGLFLSGYDMMAGFEHLGTQLRSQVLQVVNRAG
jgi:multidrug resistance efflux pump